MPRLWMGPLPMNKLTIDFETRSACNLKKRGAWVYSEDPTTDVLCMSVKGAAPAPKLWINPSLFSGCLSGLFVNPDLELRPSPFAPVITAEDIPALLEWADTIEAHNAQFEQAIWQNVCVKKYGWPPLPLEKLRCSAAKTAVHALPRSLEQSCRALGLAQQKDKEGYTIMMRMCKPRRITNKDRKEWLEGGDGCVVEEKDHFYHPESDAKIYLWHEDPDDFIKLCRYCIQDTLAEEDLSRTLRDLQPLEQKIWHLDREINTRGIYADTAAAEKMIEFVDAHEKRLTKRLRKLTNGAVKTGKQVEVLLGYLRGLGLDLPDLASATVTEALAGEIQNPQARELLEIRKSLSRSSSAKYKSILDRVSSDNRVRGSLLYHGANTGRWAGSGIQPHNFPSRIKTSDDPANMLRVIQDGGLEWFEALYDDDPMSAAGAITRSVLTAAPGKDLLVADFSAIEGRGVAWLAGEDSKLELFRTPGMDVYIATAAKILGYAYEDVTKAQRNALGKVAELACGYQGSVGAVRKFGGEGMTDEEILDNIVRPWRASHPAIAGYWYNGDKVFGYWDHMEDISMEAVSTPGKTFFYRGVGFRVQDGFMVCRLPNGRLLWYYDPDIRPVKTPWGDMKECVTYMTVDSLTKKWVRTKTYGGKLCENITQAVCRDLMAEAMLRLEAHGYPIILTVHDEIISEVDEGFGDLDEYIEIMCQVPKWAEGFPIAADGFRGKRYKK